MTRFVLRDGAMIILALALSGCIRIEREKLESDAPPLSERPRVSSGRDVRLVVLLVVDQLRADYLTRCAAHFAPSGFRRLTGGGAHFVNAYFSHGSTATGPGHATIITGRLPRQHGIVANEWYLDPDEQDAQPSIADQAVRLVGDTGESARRGPSRDRPGVSPRGLIGPALGDQLKLSDRRSRVFAVAGKDRSAVLLGGRRPDGAYWWDHTTGGVQTSTYYRDDLPHYLSAFNAERWPERFAAATWDRVLPAAAYAGCRRDAPRDTALAGDWGDAFPYSLPPAGDRWLFSMLDATPFGHEIVLELARRILVNERLGHGPAPDLLCVGLSSFDVAGHLFGPESEQMLDFVVRTDAQIAAFLDLLNRLVGLERCLVALTADHGVTTAPLAAQRGGLDAGRIDLRALWQDLNADLRRRFGSLAEGRDHVAGIVLPWVYFDPALAALDESARAARADAAAAFLRTRPGVADVFTARELTGPMPPPGDRPRWLAWRAFHPRRSGGIYIQLDPYWYKTGRQPVGHTAGSSHDRHVPIVLFGPGVRAGTCFAPADPLDIAPTLAALLGIEPPIDADGRVLHEALETAHR